MSLKNLARYEQVLILRQTGKWLLIAALVGILAGTAAAVFLASLHWATDWREEHFWILGLLPLGGLLIGWVYHRYGQTVERGNNLLLDEIHDPQATIPFRMAPLVLISTVATHFFGGSAGREGTAIQMGGSLADQLSQPLRLTNGERRVLLMAGMSAGFGAVFGTPLAGAIFGLEVLAIGRLRYEAIFPCFLAAIVGDRVTRAWGIHHTSYAINFIPNISILGLLAALVAGIAFGLTGRLFANLTHGIALGMKKFIHYPPLRLAAGGTLVTLAVWGLGTTKYIGLGIPTIQAAFTTKLPPWDFAGKLIFTAVTLGAGFKGGEVTPLFYIGATLGNALSPLLSLPAPLLAGMGFVAVFAGAANTPLASTFMALELFGAEVGVYAGLACVVSYLFSGHAGIYRAQLLGLSKHGELPTITKS